MSKVLDAQCEKARFYYFVMTLGDYPDFAPVHGLSRDFWHDWDMPPTKSDWGHVLHYEELDLTAFTEDIFSPTVEPL